VTVLRFPIHPVRVVPTGEGGWLVLWRTSGWPHASREDALAEAAAHGVRVVEP